MAPLGKRGKDQQLGRQVAQQNSEPGPWREPPAKAGRGTLLRFHERLEAALVFQEGHVVVPFGEVECMREHVRTGHG